MAEWISSIFDSQLNDEEKLVRQTARQFVENEIIPIIEKHKPRSGHSETFGSAARELDFLARTCMGYGCAGMSNVAYGLMTQELERGDSGFAQFCFGAGRAGDVSNLFVWKRRAEKHVAATFAEGKASAASD